MEEELDLNLSLSFPSQHKNPHDDDDQQKKKQIIIMGEDFNAPNFAPTKTISQNHHLLRTSCSSSSSATPPKRNYWTHQEHQQFLMGLEFYGKGTWKFISEDFVLSRTPQQVHAHAQWYFKNNGGKMKLLDDHDIKATTSKAAGSMVPKLRRPRLSTGNARKKLRGTN